MAGWASDLVWTLWGTEYYLFFSDWNRIRTPLLSNPSKPTASAPAPLIAQKPPTKFSEAQIAPANALGFQFSLLKREISYETMTMT
jgi:hypothetical protein